MEGKAGVKKAYDDTQTTMNNQIRSIIRQKGVMNTFAEKYPMTAKHLIDPKHQAGTVALLIESGAIVALSTKYAVTVNETGEDNVKTWAIYCETIESELFNIAPDVYLKQARKAIAKHIHKQHFSKFPNWPPIGKSTDKTHVTLNDSGVDLYQKDQVEVLWGVNGSITVVDEHPTKNEFRATCSGEPRLRVLQIHHTKLKSLEDLSVKHPKQARQPLINAKKAAKKGGKKLNWNDMCKNSGETQGDSEGEEEDCEVQ